MKKVKVGDFIRLKDFDNWANTRILHRTINIFSVIEVNEGKVKLDKVIEVVSVHDIEAIPIDGIADAAIYYDPLIMTDIVTPGMEIQSKSRNTSYYFERFAKCFNENGTDFQQWVNDSGCKYVHEVQDLLHSRFKRESLKINAY